MDTGALEASLREFFCGHHDGLVCAYLFGSVARGSAGPTSDVDVAVLLRSARTGTFRELPLDLEGDLERQLGMHVDVVDLRLAAPDLVHRVLRDGVLLLDADPSARIAFEVRARNEYFDVRPMLDRYRRTVSAR